MAASPKPNGDRVVARNRRASFDYDLGDKFEAGLVLVGTEVKMLRSAAADLSDTYVSIERGEAFLNGLKIPLLEGAAFGHATEKRARKMLLHAKEIETIGRSIQREGMTCVATQLYFKNGRVKVEVALARGKKHADKRESIKQKDAEREAKQAIARGRRGD
ncbi:MAG: SsrA-binding protein SmpB [Polyangiaceae bacterium]|nr:SsrA-binding protein SmpB [Polyangiaceae bacterium]